MYKAYKTNGKWRVRVPIDGGKYKTFTRATKKEAMQVAGEFELHYLENKDKSACEYWTVAEAMANYINAKKMFYHPQPFEVIKAF